MAMPAFLLPLLTRGKIRPEDAIGKSVIRDAFDSLTRSILAKAEEHKKWAMEDLWKAEIYGRKWKERQQRKINETYNDMTRVQDLDKDPFRPGRPLIGAKINERYEAILDEQNLVEPRRQPSEGDAVAKEPRRPKLKLPDYNDPKVVAQMLADLADEEAEEAARKAGKVFATRKPREAMDSLPYDAWEINRALGSEYPKWMLEKQEKNAFYASLDPDNRLSPEEREARWTAQQNALQEAEAIRRSIEAQEYMEDQRRHFVEKWGRHLGRDRN